MYGFNRLTRMDKRLAIFITAVGSLIMGNLLFIYGVSSNIVTAIVCGILILIISILGLIYIVWTYISSEDAEPIIQSSV